MLHILIAVGGKARLTNSPKNNVQHNIRFWAKAQSTTYHHEWILEGGSRWGFDFDDEHINAYEEPEILVNLLLLLGQS